MRIVILGAGGAHRTEASLARAATGLGHEFRVVDALGWRRRVGRAAPRLVRWQVDRFAPDFVLCTRHAAAIGADALTPLLAGRRSAFWYFDALTPLPPAAALLARSTSRSFVTYGFQLDALRAAGAAEVHFLPQGFDPAVDHPVESAPPEFHCDVSFVGSGQYPRRVELLRLLARSCRLQIRGPNWEGGDRRLPVAGGPVRGAAFARVVHGAALSLGIDALPAQRNERLGGTSNRLWRVLGAGGCYLGERVEGVDALARHGEHALWYRSFAEAVELTRELLADPAARARIALAGHAHALERHTYQHRLARLLAGQGYTST
jgi:spore maturation protein CgeB